MMTTNVPLLKTLAGRGFLLLDAFKDVSLSFPYDYDFVESLTYIERVLLFLPKSGPFFAIVTWSEQVESK